jgi:hypothetical protein
MELPTSIVVPLTPHTSTCALLSLFQATQTQQSANNRPKKCNRWKQEPVEIQKLLERKYKHRRNMGKNKIRICTGSIKLGSHNQGKSMAIITEEKEAGGGGKGAPLLGVNAPDADLTVIERRLLRRELLLRAAAATHRTERPDPEPETRERLAGEEEGDKPQGFASSQIKRVVFLASPYLGLRCKDSRPSSRSTV